MKVIAAKQKNHSSYILPQELWEYATDSDKILYLLVARWCLVKSDFVCCDDVANNFGISKRQASNIISNIHRKYSRFIICSIKRIKVGKGNVYKNYIKVTDILDKRSPVKSNFYSDRITEGDSFSRKYNNNSCWGFLSQKWS